MLQFLLSIDKAGVIYNLFYLRSKWKVPVVIRMGWAENISMFITPWAAFLCGQSPGCFNIPSHTFMGEETTGSCWLLLFHGEMGTAEAAPSTLVLITGLCRSPSLGAYFSSPFLHWLACTTHRMSASICKLQ